MASNGTLTPSLLPLTALSPLTAKRKLVEHNGASATGQQTYAHSGAYPFQMVLEDVLSVLKSYDIEPSILSHPITTSVARNPSGEADSKRAKLIPPVGPASIKSLIQEASYLSLHALAKDVETATAEIIAANTKDECSDIPPSQDQLTIQAKVLAFQKVAKNLIAREEMRMAQHEKADSEHSSDAKASNEEREETPVILKVEDGSQSPQSRTVLTLYGGTLPHKQLFSSLQQPYQVRPIDAGTLPNLDNAVKIVLPLREMNLPNIISTTEVYPLQDSAESKKDTPSTFGDRFRAPAYLPQISPPKTARPTTSKGNNTITFAPPSEAPKPKRKGSQSYAHQHLASGFWLGYGGVDMPREQISPTAKQKSRQRALSMGESQQPPSEAILVAVQQAKEDALFRSAYSSFAPTRDDASAVIPEEIKNMVWWQKVGAKRFNEMFPIDPALLDTEHPTDAPVKETVEEEDFKNAVENFVPVEENPFSGTQEKSAVDKDTDELLKDISELLETLASYQRIRNSSLTTNPRTPVVQNSSLANLAGSPSTPSTEEADVYQMLKSQLTLLISQLPPYAVAKLNGDQMDELNISRTILYDTKEYRGVLEEDQLSRLAKAPAVTPPTPSTLSRVGPGIHGHYAPGGSQYSRPTPSMHHSSSRSSFSQQQPPLHRSSSMHVQRSPSGSTQTFQASGASYAPSSRSGFPSTPSLGQTRTGYASTSSKQYYLQRSAQPGSYGAAAGSQSYGNTPQTQSRYTAQSSQNGYYSRSQNVAPMYGTSQSTQPRVTSPMKGIPAQSASRIGFSTPGGQSRSTYFGPSQYGGPQTPSTPTLQMMMSGHQTQGAAQSQARLAAQNSFNPRQGSETPQPQNGAHSSVNGMSSMQT